MNGNASSLAFAHLALPSMDSCTDLDSKSPYALADGRSAVDRPAWTVEKRKKPVSCGVYFAPLESREFPPYQNIMALKEVAPASIAELSHALCRAYNIRPRISLAASFPRKPRSRANATKSRSYSQT